MKLKIKLTGVFEVRDMLGRIVQHLSINSNTKQLTIDASDLSSGMYLYSLSDGTKIQSRTMMVVK